MSSIAKFVRDLNRVESKVDATANTPKLSHSSVDDGGAITFNDPDGNPLLIVGGQYDGTTTAAPVGGAIPPMPSKPMVIEHPASLRIFWDGTFAGGALTPMDWSKTTVHIVEDPADFDPLDGAQIYGEFNTALGGEVSPSLPPGTLLYVYLVAWSLAGKFSVESEYATGTPGALVTQADFDAVNAQVDEINSSLGDVPAVFRQADQPIVALGKTAVWFDTDDSNVPWFNDGTSWSKVQYGSGALAANAVVAETIAAGALNGKTITGPLIQTVATAARGIKLVNSSLVAYDAAGLGTFTLDGATGSVSLVGPIVSGGSMTSTLIQTTPTANRGIKLIGSNLRAWNSSGVMTFDVDGVTGDVTTLGTYRSAPSPAQRVEIATGPASDPLVNRDFNTIKFYSGTTGESPSQLQSNPDYGVNLVSGSEPGAVGNPKAWVYLYPKRAGVASSGAVTIESPGEASFRALGGSLLIANAAGAVGGSLATGATVALSALRSGADSDLFLGATKDVVFGGKTWIAGRFTKITSESLSRLEVNGTITGWNNTELTIGSTFTAGTTIANVTTTGGSFTSYSTIRKFGKILFLEVGVTPQGNTAAGAQACSIPAGYRPTGGNLYFWASDANTSTPVQMYVTPAGGLHYSVARSAGQLTVGSYMFMIA